MPLHPDFMNQRLLSLFGGLTITLAASTAWGAAFVRNPSFESNFNNITDPPVAGLPQGWPYYSSVDEWSGASGVNDVEYDPNGPFHNAGTPVPDRVRVGFKQGGGDVTQDISGLEPGGTYWLQFFYDGRRGGGGSQELVVRFNDTEIGRDANLKPSTGEYYFMNAPFTVGAETDTGTIRFTHVVPAGDHTVLLDSVTVVARDTNDIVLMNPSFEASGTLPAVGPVVPLAGWAQTGTVGVDDGTAGHANNGAIPDQDLVAFIQGAGSISQALDGLIVGNEYEIRVAVNAGTGTSPRLQIKVGDAVLADQDVPAQSYQNLSLKFTATATDTTLTLAQSKEGTDTLLIDNVRLLGVVKKPLPPMAFSPLVSEVSPGEVVTHTLAIPAEAVATAPVLVRLSSSNPTIGRLEGAADDGSLTLRFEVGVTSQTFAIEALNRGTVTVNVLEAAKIPVTATPAANVVGSLVKNPSFESSIAPAFPGYGPIVGWQGQGQTGLNRAGSPTDPAGPFGDNGIVPDREQVAFIQGAGALSQQIRGLRPGRHYWLQFRYNARNCCEERSQTLSVRFAGQVLATYADLKPVADAGEVNYYFASLPLAATEGTGLLEFVHEVASGDASVVIDAVNMVPRATDELVIQNPSFEASGSPPGVGYLQPYLIAGWEGGPGGRGVNVDGEGPFSDNGDVPDQDRTLFLQGVGSSLSQTVSGLSSGQKYTLVFGINARNCCGGVPVARVSLNEVPLIEEEAAPVGGRNPFASKYLIFTADSADAAIKFEISGPAGSDVSLLVDDVHLVPGERTAPVITVQPAGAVIDVGNPIILTVTATGNNLTYRWHRNGVPLADGGRISGVLTPTLSIPQGLPQVDDGDYTVLISDGLGVIASDPALVEVVGPPAAPAIRAMTVAAGVELRWPADAAGFRLQKTNPLGGAWSDVTDPILVDGNDNVVTVGTEVGVSYFRLTD